ncbi:nicotinate-nucleotide--dimethylbenzimidazole phosphoribosyltransferase [Flavobacterium johnsoniae]|uniref:Nicotinate-nucleotide--dimethylbenzimidazole phosphoribosyltransferase n=1 Tax=Flavobacterium johnsoniae (strain ATCC 17061 / DSM 2064 / JCM 8514 / BCRC 14874 / CCUG 350202 / NBRC 14942 / NCIMB 11054 / UW101) TaxID=376686 RepID=A5FNU1_FLAJ1|nr:nicotinate-nucleotide--dimethylbenzimidazole phosphoribosyltransferase [Flavobacterium johnsoniae]ABQ03125.1 cob(II)yrinic acid a,c-diamide reductase [Flavobacterium johnsoniae UW101]OXG01441.1 5,6-dimethylbenzimidazole synthase [Flavobacterium johnsoniae UW101]WQG80012.1 nicotinate-nucleotide--dimethylbenzimidazole phosphoribosyltransferase [Flavobacterium johnsoniae UW101]SHL84495.1 nicotinate-nucleotide-dimethylbenzimidazole phosphoribosyltransferase /cob(II)yrinic acid a,c-diamide reduct
MSHLDDILKSRRDTRHFTTDEVPDEVIQKALQAGHWAPSVGLTDATRYYIIKSDAVKSAIKNLFLDYNKKAEELTDNPEQKELYKSLKLEAIEEAPIGLIIAYDRSVLNQFTIGTIGSNEAVKFSSVCAAQNIWLSLTEQGYGMGWVSILNYFQFKKILDLPENIEPLGYFCIGKPATNYGNQPMLQQLHWKQKSETADCKEINEIHQINISDFDLKKETKADPKTDFAALLQEKIDSKTKPLGSLGTLETLAFQMASVFETLNPKIINPNVVVFAADHGIANHGVSDYPQDVTRQMVNNFLNGGAAINVFCKQNNIELSIVDSGVNYDFPTNAKLINAKIAKGTQSFLYASAMSETELQLCFEKGKSIVENIAKTGSNCIGFGEMGIGNTSTASVLMSLLTGLPIEECVGKGTGINDQKLLDKQNILKKALENYSGQTELKQHLAYFGGFEIMQMAGGMLTAFENKMLILVDGFICSVAFLIAFKINPNIKQNAIFCHCSAEKAHLKLLEYLDAKPILNLDLRLGEGTGCAVAFPILKSAEAFLNEMASFESVGISKK